MRVAVIGQVQVETGRVWVPSRRKERGLLAALVLGRGAPLSVDRLADALWGEQLPASPAKAVQNHVLRVRHALGSDAIQTVTGGYALAEVATTDVDELADALRIGLDERARIEERRGALRRAQALRRGQVYEDLLDWPPARAEISRVEELLCIAEEESFTLDLVTRDRPGLVAELRRAARAQPLRERRWVLLVTALRTEDRMAEARAALHDARRVLLDEGGVNPGPELLAHETSLGIEQPPRAAPAPPWTQLLDRVMRTWRRGRGRELDEAIIALSALHTPSAAVAAHRIAAVRSAWLLLRGDLVGAQAEADRAARVGRRDRDHWVSPIHQAQSVATMREQGRFAELRSIYEQFAALGTPPVALQRGFLAHGLLLSGHAGRARQVLAVDAAASFDSVPDDDLRLTILCLYAEVASATGASDATARLDQLLAPHAAEVVFDGAVCLGAVARYLGLIAAVEGRLKDSDDHLCHAVEINRTLRAPAWVARTLAERAVVLARCSDATYRPEGLITEAIEIATNHDLPGAVADIERAANMIGYRRSPGPRVVDRRGR